MIVAWSSASRESDWVLDEATKGLRRGILIPIFFEDVEPPMPFGSIHTENFVAWKGDIQSVEFQKLKQTIAERLDSANAKPWIDGGPVDDSPCPERKPSILRKLMFTFALLALVASVYFWSTRNAFDEPPPISSTVVVVSKGAKEKIIYAADTELGEIRAWRATELSKPYAHIPVGTSGNLSERGRPEQMLAMRHDKSDWIFVTDTKLNKIHVIEGEAIIGSFSVDMAPRGLAATPDGNRLFVSNEQPAPTGSIQVFDIAGPDPNKFAVGATIKNVNCPEGLALSPSGDLLFVATQCGGGKDPVFMIDTRTNQVEGSIPGLAVGVRVATSSDGERLYVSRGDYPCNIPNGEKGSPLSVVNTKTRTILNTLCMRASVGPLAISRDKPGRYLFVGNGDRLTVLDRLALDDPGLNRRMMENPAKTLREIRLNEIQFKDGVSGFGVADDNSLYAFAPNENLLYLYNPQGL